jgi:hypothetical protein
MAHPFKTSIFNCPLMQGIMMKTYSIFEHPDRRLETVKQGFSFPGLLGGGFWLLWHRMWFLGAVATGLGLGIYLLFPNPEGYVYGIPYGHRFGLADIINLGICGMVGFSGNAWRSASLHDRGFEDVGTEQASTLDGAKAAYLRRGKAARHEPSFVRREPF